MSKETEKKIKSIAEKIAERQGHWKWLNSITKFLSR